jgi:hypothetical protein
MTPILPQIPNNAFILIGICVVFFVYKMLGGYAEDLGHRIFKTNPKSRRKYDEPDWLHEYIESNNRLAIEIHSFSERMAVAVDQQARMHKEIVEKIEELSRFHQKMEGFQCEFRSREA